MLPIPSRSYQQGFPVAKALTRTPNDVTQKLDAHQKENQIPTKPSHDHHKETERSLPPSYTELKSVNHYVLLCTTISATLHHDNCRYSILMSIDPVGYFSTTPYGFFKLQKPTSVGIDPGL